MNMEAGWGSDHHDVIGCVSIEIIWYILLTPLNSHPMIAPR